jgi:hypothetical protein
MFLIASSFVPSSLLKASEGQQAPSINLQNKYGKINTADIVGHKTIINFWSANDAQSRVANIRYSQIAESSNGKIKFISVCTDSDTSMCREICKIDGINPELIFYADDCSIAATISSFRANSANNSWLISEDGKIESFNPSPDFI